MQALFDKKLTRETRIPPAADFRSGSGTGGRDRGDCPATTIHGMLLIGSQPGPVIAGSGS